VSAALLSRARAAPVAWWVELFAVANLAFLGLDIALAHSANAFARREEWIPVMFSGAAPLLLLPGLTSRRARDATRGVAILAGAAAIFVGIAGMLFHLESAFFARATLENLVYAAPFVAPLAYVGVGLLLLLNRMESWDSAGWALWVLVLALGGFAGNLGLALLDHAQNGFFHPSEWIAVGGAAFATSFLLLVVWRPEDAVLRRACAVALALAAAVGFLGFGLHLAAIAARPGSWVDRFLYGAPAFAPLLFPNLAILGGLGLWALERALAPRAGGAAVSPA
jgi:hypothetical protein